MKVFEKRYIDATNIDVSDNDLHGTYFFHIRGNIKIIYKRVKSIKAKLQKHNLYVIWRKSKERRVKRNSSFCLSKIITINKKGSGEKTQKKYSQEKHTWILSTDWRKVADLCHHHWISVQSVLKETTSNNQVFPFFCSYFLG